MVMGWDAVESVGHSDEDAELAVELDDDGRGQEPVVFVTRSRGTRRSHDSRLPCLCLRLPPRSRLLVRMKSQWNARRVI